MDKRDDLMELQARVRLLEARVQALRTSRRVLMNLLTAQERRMQDWVRQLETENRKLQQRAGRYAHALFERNLHVVRLQEQLRDVGTSP